MDLRWIAAIGFVALTSAAVVLGVAVCAILESTREELKAIRNAVEEIRAHSVNLDELAGGCHFQCNYPEQEDSEFG